MNTYILPHLGMGDYIIVNGLIRNIIKRAPAKNYILFCNDRFTISVPFMFRDIKNMAYSIIPQIEMNEHVIQPYIKDFIYELILIGYHHMDYKTPSDMMFYKQFSVDFEKRWTDFYVERDNERELNLFNSYNIKENEYILIQEDKDRKQLIDRNRIKSNLKVIEIEKDITDNIFDYCYLIEQAAEIHCIESSFLFLIDSIHTNGKLFSHRYARPLYNYTIPNLKKKWAIEK
jgi:hypothetical protein